MALVEVILKEDVPKLGYKYDLVKVKAGYARNYLIPKGYALPATPSNKKMYQEIKKQRSAKEEKMLTDAQALADKHWRLTLIFYFICLFCLQSYFIQVLFLLDVKIIKKHLNTIMVRCFFSKTNSHIRIKLVRQDNRQCLLPCESSAPPRR